MGRRKISIAPIADDRNRSVTFLKRKNGLFKKAYELGVLCSADVAVIVFNNAGKLYEFHSGDMDQILLRYSHYSGPAYEKRGPEDYAAKNQAELLKAGAGGKIDAAVAGGDDDEEDALSDDSVDEKPTVQTAAAKKGGKRGGKAAVTPSARAHDTTAQSQHPLPQDGGNYGQANVPQYSSYNQQQQPGQWQNQPQNGYSLPPSLPGVPQRAATMPMINPWLQPGSQPSNISQWAMQSLYSAAAAAAAGSAPNGANMQQMGAPSYQLPPLGGMPDFGMLQQAYQQSQQPPPSSTPFFSGLPGMPQAQSMFYGTQQQQHQPQPPAQNSTQAHIAQHQGQLTSSPQSSSQRGTPDVDSASREDSDQSAAATPNTAGGTREPPSRSNSINNKPKLSVNIPPNADDSNGAQQRPSLQVTGTSSQSQMDEDDGSRTAHPMHQPNHHHQQHSARYATDLLPSPSGFLNDVIYASGQPYSSLSGLNTAIAMTNGEDGRQVFQWPVMNQQGQQQQQQQQTSVPNSDVRDERQNDHESAERLSGGKRRSMTDEMSVDGERPGSSASSAASKRSKHA
ncbi:hypothetical protein ACM66B_003463 [Microbotryomycetes sp. NB124-2]